MDYLSTMQAGMGMPWENAPGNNLMDFNAMQGPQTLTQAALKGSPTPSTSDFLKYLKLAMMLQQMAGGQQQGPQQQQAPPGQRGQIRPIQQPNPYWQNYIAQQQKGVYPL